MTTLQQNLQLCRMRNLIANGNRLFWSLMRISVNLLLVCSIPILTNVQAASTDGQAAPDLRIGFSTLVFGDVNKNDSLAAVRVWAETMAKDRNIQASPKPLIFNGIDEISAASPPVIPIVFCFRAGYDSPIRGLFSDEISLWHNTTAGRQILTIFQTERLDVHPASILDSTMYLIAEHRRYVAKNNSAAGKSDMRTKED